LNIVGVIWSIWEFGLAAKFFPKFFGGYIFPKVIHRLIHRLLTGKLACKYRIFIGNLKVIHRK
jgi:hypothetical protein